MSFVLTGCDPELKLNWTELSVILCTAMEVLDGDDVRLSSRGRFAERDIVQVTRPSLKPWLHVKYNYFAIILVFYFTCNH